MNLARNVMDAIATFSLERQEAGIAILTPM